MRKSFSRKKVRVAQVIKVLDLDADLDLGPEVADVIAKKAKKAGMTIEEFLYEKIRLLAEGEQYFTVEIEVLSRD